MLTPARLWKRMSADQRTRAARAFWEDEQSADDQMQAVLLISQQKKFRPKSVMALDLDRKSRHLASLHNVPETVAARALISYHLAEQRPMMGAFLDALGIAHENGLIKDETVAAPSKDRLVEAIAKVRESFPAEDVDLYLRTLTTLDGDTWANVDEALTAAGPATA